MNARRMGAASALAAERIEGLNQPRRPAPKRAHMTSQEATNRPGDRATAQPVSVTPPRSPRRAGWRIWPLVACALLVTPITAAAETGPTDAKAPAPPATVAGTTASATAVLGSGLTAGVPVAVPALGSPDSGPSPAPPDVEEMQGGGSPPTETVEYYAYDAIGSVRVVFDLAGAVVGQATYGPFGQEIAGTADMPTQRFTGQERDHEAQLDYFNARSLQTRTGRFASPDPLWAGGGDPQRWNRYGYALNNPLMFTDTTGLKADFRTGVEVCITCENSFNRFILAMLLGSSGFGSGGETSGGGDPGSYYGGRSYSAPASLPPVAPPSAQTPPGGGSGPAPPAGPTTPNGPGSGTPSAPVAPVGTGGPGGQTNAPPTQRLFPPESIRNTPRTGPPETWMELYKNRDVVTMRRFGPSGAAQFDIDVNQEHRPYRDIHAHWWDNAKRGLPMTLGELIMRLGGSMTISPVISINPCLMSATMCTHYDLSSKPM